MLLLQRVSSLMLLLHAYTVHTTPHFAMMHALWFASVSQALALMKEIRTLLRERRSPRPHDQRQVSQRREASSPPVS